MADVKEVVVPDIGDFSDVPIIEVLFAEGDSASPEAPLVTLESDKATMDVPAPFAGTVAELRVGVGDRVSEGTVILLLDAEQAPEPPPAQRADVHAEVLVLGAGPGGYTAAFRAADLGRSV